MEILGNPGGSPIYYKHLLSSVKNAREGNIEKAYEFAALYFDEIMFYDFKATSEVVVEDERGAVDEALLCRRNRSIKYGLVFTARLARMFGHFSKAHFLLIEAVQQAQSTNDFVCLRLALLEETMLEIVSTRPAMLGRYVRSEKVPAIDARLKEMFSNRVYTLGLSSRDDFTPFEERFFADKQKFSCDPGAKAFTEQLVLCSKFIKALNLAIKCESPEKVLKYLKSCLAVNLGVDRQACARLISDAARATISTIQLGLLKPPKANFERISTNIANLCEENERKNSFGKRIKSEANVIECVNSAYNLAMDGNFEGSIKIIQKTKHLFPYEENPMLSYHWELAEACILFDYNLFHGINTDSILESLQCFSPTEAIFRNALLLANRCEFYDASNLLNQRLNFLRKGIDTIVILRCLMLMGLVYCEGGAFQAGLNALKYALEIAKKKQLEVFVAMIQRRLAFAQTFSSSGFEHAEKLLEESGRILEKTDSPRLERGLYYVTCYEYYKRRIYKHDQKHDSIMEIEEHVIEEENPQEREKNLLSNNLSLALETFYGHYPQLEKNIYREILQLSSSHLGPNDSLRKMCAEILDFGKFRTVSGTLNWFLL